MLDHKSRLWFKVFRRVGFFNTLLYSGKTSPLPITPSSVVCHHSFEMSVSHWQRFPEWQSQWHCWVYGPINGLADHLHHSVMDWCTSASPRAQFLISRYKEGIRKQVSNYKSMSWMREQIKGDWLYERRDYSPFADNVTVSCWKRSMAGGVGLFGLSQQPFSLRLKAWLAEWFLTAVLLALQCPGLAREAWCTLLLWPYNCYRIAFCLVHVSWWAFLP